MTFVEAPSGRLRAPDAMWTIRREQMRILAAPFLEKFVHRAVEHVRAHFPAQHAALGDAGVRDAVVHAIERAEAHGLERDEHVLAYLTLVFVFGRDFDRDPALPWASEALASGKSAAFRMSRLRALALAHQDAGRGYAGGEATDRG